ncbi:MAG TPA: hypothetical protein DEB34_00535 [Lactobacillus sp.]|uniref:restriction endonuclease subunit S n=1 Tax=Ligilactobacillus salivarius TaxID=1624 RepID=UPI000E80A116|nr:restriction endonuclease subunit S [Ligilactobacillus salivarius]MYZ24655.1 hypothetical protein [Ligilactobacillus salivarius]HBU67135.1 hypothetical protein [Lactobacillus sp.]
MKYKIKDVAKINKRVINKKYNGTINYMDTSSVTDNVFNDPKVYSSIKEAPSRARRVANLGDTIISTVRPNMKHTGFIDKARYKDCIYSTGFAIVTPFEDRVDPFYLYLVLTNNENTELLQSIGETSTSTYPSVKPSDIENLEHDFPSINEQKEISTTIKMLENKIYLNNKINTNLFELANIIFQQSFNCNGNIPLSHYFLPKRGKNLLKKNVEPGAVPVVAGGLKPAAYHNISNTETPVITISASGANAGYVQIWGQKVWSSDSSYIDSSITDNIYFWYIFLKSRQKQIFDAQTGSAQPHIYPKHIGNLLISELDEEQVQSFNKKVTPIFEKIFQNQRNNSVMEDVKNSLLYKFFNDY